ncbi:MAG: protein-disulfide reductase DsbD domain-containing protein [Terriglobales bacterium]
MGSQSQDIGSFSAPKASPRNRVQYAPPRTVHVSPGAKASTELEFRVNPGYHINSNQPGSELLVPTQLKLSPPTNVIVGDVQYPAGHDFTLAASPDEKLNVYTGDFSVATLVTATRNTPPGLYRVHGFLQYQACDDRSCYPPAKLPIAFDVRVGRAAKAHRRNPAQSPDIHN